MPHRASTQSAQQWIDRLQQIPRMEGVGPIAARFLYSLRLITVHERAKRDPVPELAARLGSIVIASKALALAHAISTTWPENVHVSRFCCSMLTHDEATIAAMLEAATSANNAAFETAIRGLVRPERIQHLWECALVLSEAELSGG